jgi:streptogramin lyase
MAAHIELPGCEEPVGVSIDAAGSVWVVDRGASTAYRVDPDTQTVDATVTGLVDPYTYSDMTGAGLDVVVNPPVG